MPFESLVTQPKPKRESEMMKALGKWKGSEYSSGFRKEEVGDCTIYWHKDARNMEELAKILGILKKAQEGSSKQFGTVSGADLTESQKRTICWGLDKPVGSLNDEAHCCVQATANFVYSYKGED